MAAGDVEPDCLTALPSGVVLKILQELDPFIMLQAAVVCRTLRTASEEAIQSVASLSLNNLPGARSIGACSWLASNEDKLRALKSIELQGASVVQGGAVQGLVAHGSKLLGQLTRLTFDAVKALRDEHLALVLEHTTRLECLEVSSCKVTDAGVMSCSRLCPSLRRLVVRDCFGVTDTGVAYLSLHSKQLQSVALDGCVHVTSDAVSLLVERCPQLAELSLEKCPRIKGRAFDQLERAPCRATLSRLSLRQCAKFGGLAPFKACTALASLDLAGCAEVTDQDLTSFMAVGGPALQSLSLGGCKCVTGEVLGPVGALCPGLKRLELRGLPLRDAQLQALAAAAAQHPGGVLALQELNLIWCTRLTELGLEPLLRATPSMARLDLEALYLVTDRLLGLLADLTPGLRHLNVRLCHLLGPGALVALVEALPRLHSLALSGVMAEQETTACVQRMRALRPTMRLAW